MSMVPWVSYRPGTWLIDECQIAFFMSCLMLRVWTHLFCCYFQCHLSYHQQFVWYPGYHGYQFCAPLLPGEVIPLKQFGVWRLSDYLVNSKAWKDWLESGQ